MKQDVFHQIWDLADTVYRKDLARLQSLNAAEQAAQDAIEDLDKARIRNTEALLLDAKGQKSIGGDVLWQAWMSRARIAKQLEIAQIRAQKEHVLQTIRVSFGRRHAAQTLKENYIADARKDVNKKLQFEQDCLSLVAAAGACGARKN